MDRLRAVLLDLHRALIEAERVAIERERGRLTATEMWQLLVEDPQLAWLGALSQLIVRLDEGLAPADEAAFRAQLRTLLVADDAGSEFHRRYGGHLQGTPEVVLAHRAVTAVW